MRWVAIEAAILVFGFVIGYVGLALAQRAGPPPAPVVAAATRSPTPTVAPAVTFTPVPSPTATALGTPKAAGVTPNAVLTVTPAQATPAARTTPKATPSPAPRTYIVRAGDTIEAIARANGVSEDALVHANGLTDPNKLAEGQKLIIP